MVREDNSSKPTSRRGGRGGGGVHLSTNRSRPPVPPAVSYSASSSSPDTHEGDEDEEDRSSSSDDGGEAIVVDPSSFCQPEMSPVGSAEAAAEADPLGGATTTARQHRKRKSDHGEHLWEHPEELKKLLVGDLSKEMCVSVSRKGGAAKQLSHLDCDPGFDSLERHRFVPMHFEVKPIKQHGDSDFYDNISIHPFPEDSLAEEDEEEELAADGNRVHEREDRITGRGKIPSPLLKQGDAKEDVFVDPETGLTRYKCRNNCGTSLASAKGRRKHERRHCPLASEGHSVK